jgi:alanyl-tRNA synthetase
MQPTERLYYADSYLQRFDARIIAQRDMAAGPAVALDRSAFYPEGGGQPADSGTLNDVPVRDVQAEGDVVWHVLAAPLTGDEVVGAIDWARRFDHMQQHHGQHLLSAAFENRFGLRTVSFHLGAAAATIDLATSSLDAEVIEAAEALANAVIWEARPVLARFVGAAELASIPLRKPPTVSGPIRVVSVPEFDHSACGGTHPHTTGGVGMLHVRRWERRGEQVRVEFVCGARALADLRRKHAVLSRIAAGMSIGIDEVDAAVARLQAAEERARLRADALGAALRPYEAQALIDAARTIGSLRVVRQSYDDRSIDEAREIARRAAEAGCVALIGVRAEKAHVIVARGAGSTLDSGALLREALAPLGGRGGGRPELAQGGLPDAERLEAALDALEQQIARQG